MFQKNKKTYVYIYENKIIETVVEVEVLTSCQCNITYSTSFSCVGIQTQPERPAARSILQQQQRTAPRNPLHTMHCQFACAGMESVIDKQGLGLRHNERHSGIRAASALSVGVCRAPLARAASPQASSSVHCSSE